MSAAARGISPFPTRVGVLALAIASPARGETPSSASPSAAPPAAVVAPLTVRCEPEGRTPRWARSERSVTLLACDALRARGIGAEDPGGAAGPEDTVFRVGFEPSGSRFVLRITREEGGRTDARSVVVSDTLEAPSAIARLVDDLVGVPRPAEPVREGAIIAVGPIGVLFSRGGRLGGGGEAKVGYERSGYGLTLDARLAVAGSYEDPARYRAISAGGHVYTSDSDVSGVLGAGLAFLWLDVEEERTGGRRNWYGVGEGWAPFVSVGIAFLRSRALRGSAALRVDIPSFRLEDTYVAPAPASSRIATPASAGQVVSESFHVVPITLGLALEW